MVVDLDQILAQVRAAGLQQLVWGKAPPSIDGMGGNLRALCLRDGDGFYLVAEYMTETEEVGVGWFLGEEDEEPTSFWEGPAEGACAALQAMVQARRGRIEEIAERALEAFWATVAEMVPEAISGDLSIETTIEQKEQAREAVAEWLRWNV